ncbi:hypothetical protein ACHQM5_019101 [Ranunculus cassubicifolius]
MDFLSRIFPFTSINVASTILSAARLCFLFIRPIPPPPICPPTPIVVQTPAGNARVLLFSAIR